MAIPLVAGAFVGGLIQAAGSLVGRVLIALGVGFVTYTGIQATLTSMQGYVQGWLQAMPADVLGILGLMKIDVAVSIMFSAVAARLVLKGITSDTIKRMVFK